MSRSKTIQIFLKDSEPDGIKIARISISTAKVYVIPRDKINYAATRRDLATPALYLLFDDERTSVYVGECENFVERIKGHEINKDFWHWAVVAVASDGSLDKADVKYLESCVINRTVETNRFEVQNRTSPNLTNLDEFKQESALDFFDDVELLISALGFNLFEPYRDVLETQKPKKSVQTRTRDIRDYDTIVCPSTASGFRNAFIDKGAWWAVRVGQPNIPKLKYLAIYESAPISAIRHYAKITKIEPYPDKPGKYIIYHDGDVKEFDPHIVMGDNHQLALFGPRYYKLSTMKKSTSLAELTDKTYGTSYQKQDKV